jgi:hypothetical protein
MNISLAAAALAGDLNKTTLLIVRAIKSGRVSRLRDEHGQSRIATAEPHRVYLPAPQRSAPDAPQRETMPTLEAQIAGLREVADLLRAQLDETRRDRDKWADAATAALRALPTPAESLPTRSRKLMASSVRRGSRRAPVRGLRPIRAWRCLTENAPKSRNSTRSPRASAAMISLKIALTIFSTSR